MLHRLPHFNDVLAHANSIRCMLVRSGTSRLLLLDGAEIRSGKAGYEQVRRIMLGVDGHGGFGGQTSQENKVALVWPEDETGEFRYRFLQVIAHSGVVLPMECSNSASASAMLAQMSEPPERMKLEWRATNLSTGQKVELRPHPERGVARAWHVRFLATPTSRKALSGLCGTSHVRVLGQKVEMTPVMLGNLFLFTRIDPARLDPESVETIAREGMRVARTAGFSPPEGYHPKVIPYRIVSEGATRTIETASYYHGERHRSMPGSAAMALAGFLEIHGEHPPADNPQWIVRHPSGTFDVRLSLEARGGETELAWAEFTTPVQLLGWGVAALNRRSQRR
jgi:hypothetical protein